MVWTHTHTPWTKCSTWTTKVVSNNNIQSCVRASFCCFLDPAHESCTFALNCHSLILPHTCSKLKISRWQYVCSFLTRLDFYGSQLTEPSLTVYKVVDRLCKTDNGSLGALIGQRLGLGTSLTLKLQADGCRTVHRACGTSASSCRRYQSK